MSAFAQRWNRYWFAPAPALNLGICRILMVSVQLLVLIFPFALLTRPPYTRFEEMATLPDADWNPIYLFTLLTLPLGSDYRPNAEHLHLVFIITKIAGFFALFGLFTRASLAVFTLGLIFIVGHSHSYLEHHHIETIPTIFLLLLTIGPSGQRLSIDSWLRNRSAPNPPLLEDESAQAGWPLKLMAWLLSMIYLSAALSKVGGSGLDWFNGFTLQHYMIQDALYWGQDLGMKLGQNLFLLKAMSCFSVIWEATFFFVLIWPRLSIFYVLAGVGFHLGVYFTMKAPFVLYFPAYAALIRWDLLAKRF